MTGVFRSYARHYDALYREKEYDRECDRVEDAFRAHGDGGIQRVLDVGCGTGRHAIEMARRGYEVVGADRSEEMLDVARARTVHAGLPRPPRFVRAEASDLVVAGDGFDAAISMFAVVSYLATDREVREGLASIRSRLRSRGLLIFDFWSGPGVLLDPPVERFKVVPAPEGEIVRLASPVLDLVAQTVDVRYRILVRQGDHVTRDETEVHRMRFFFPREISLLLDEAGFDVVAFHPEGRPHDRLDVGDWQATVVARVRPT